MNVGQELPSGVIPELLVEFVVCEDEVFLLGEDELKGQNSMQIVQSYQRVFASADDFDLARRVCETSPEQCDPKRERFVRSQNSRSEGKPSPRTSSMRFASFSGKPAIWRKPRRIACLVRITLCISA